jgi:hypothetical protein
MGMRIDPIAKAQMYITFCNPFRNIVFKSDTGDLIKMIGHWRILKQGDKFLISQEPRLPISGVHIIDR